MDFRFKPTKAWLSTGTGLSPTSKLNAFDKCLVDAGVGHLNLIEYSSILPKDVIFEDFLEGLEAGQATGAIMATASGDGGSKIASAIGIALTDQYGLVAKASDFSNLKEAQNAVKNRLKEMCASRKLEVEEIITTVSNLDVPSGLLGSVVALVVFDPSSYV